VELPVVGAFAEIVKVCTADQPILKVGNDADVGIWQFVGTMP
jgi:hypothetical protein